MVLRDVPVLAAVHRHSMAVSVVEPVVWYGRPYNWVALYVLSVSSIDVMRGIPSLDAIRHESRVGSKVCVYC